MEIKKGIKSTELKIKTYVHTHRKALAVIVGIIILALISVLIYGLMTGQLGNWLSGLANWLSGIWQNLANGLNSLEQSAGNLINGIGGGIWSFLTTLGSVIFWGAIAVTVGLAGYIFYRIAKEIYKLTGGNNGGNLNALTSATGVTSATGLTFSSSDPVSQALQTISLNGTSEGITASNPIQYTSSYLNPNSIITGNLNNILSSTSPTSNPINTQSTSISSVLNNIQSPSASGGGLSSATIIQWPTSSSTSSLINNGLVSGYGGGVTLPASSESGALQKSTVNAPSNFWGSISAWFTGAAAAASIGALGKALSSVSSAGTEAGSSIAGATMIIPSSILGFVPNFFQVSKNPNGVSTIKL